MIDKNVVGTIFSLRILLISFWSGRHVSNYHHNFNSSPFVSRISIPFSLFPSVYLHLRNDWEWIRQVIDGNLLSLVGYYNKNRMCCMCLRKLQTPVYWSSTFLLLISISGTYTSHLPVLLDRSVGRSADCIDCCPQSSEASLVGVTEMRIISSPSILPVYV